MSAAGFSFKPGQRRVVKVSGEDLVRTGHLDGCDGFPLVVQPNAEAVSLAGWAAEHRGLVEDWLLRYGAVLFRGFGVDSIEGFDEVTRSVTPDLLDYQERAAPRVQVAKNIFSSTEYAAEGTIPMHHEMSYSHNWPTKLWFYCVQPARDGGRTPLAEDRKVFGRIDPEIKRELLARKVMYVRNYGEGIDLSWQDAFQTTDRAAVEEYCARAGMTVEWRDRDRLRTRSVRQAVAMHPKTGETVWFNHAHMFHVSNLEPEVRRALLAQFAPDELPRNAFFGDGAPIPDEMLEGVRETYRQTAIGFDWNAGDVLLLDNFLTSHGREPYAGPRRIVVAMAELYTYRD
jgi:alpha-ketoglutarate-dependent taurine dioxygenase